MRRAVAIAFFVVFGVIAARLLPAGGSAGTGFAPAHTPPFDASWTRSPSNPILSPTVAWEGTWVQEPTVMFESGWKMWYTGGSGASAYGMGYATCPLGSDPTDPAHWTKYGGNPIIGQGGSGIAGPASRNHVVKVGTTYYAYYTNGTDDLAVTTSVDGISWGTPAIAIAHGAAAFATGWVNSVVWNEGGADWHMLVEAIGSTAVDRIVAATTSPDGITWATPASGAIASLEINGGYTGGPSLLKVGSTYHLWEHASNTTSGGGLPTDIYHATSTGLATWTVSPATPILTHLGSSFEIDQVADPSVIVYAGTAYLFYTGAENVGAGSFKIGVATAPAS